MSNLHLVDQPPPDAALVRAVEDLLAAVNSGKVHAVAIAGLGASGDVWAIVSGKIRPYTMVGAVEYLKMRVLRMIEE